MNKPEGIKPSLVAGPGCRSDRRLPQSRSPAHRSRSHRQKWGETVTMLQYQSYLTWIDDWYSDKNLLNCFKAYHHYSQPGQTLELHGTAYVEEWINIFATAKPSSFLSNGKAHKGSPSFCKILVSSSVGWDVGGRSSTNEEVVCVDQYGATVIIAQVKELQVLVVQKHKTWLA